MIQYRIRNWSRFQHYKERNPPWIKLHVEILASEDWVSLADASKLLAVVCMVVAAKNGGLIPDNPDYIKRVAYLDKRPNLKPLVECGFLEIVQADAIECKQLLADDSTLQATARPEAETYRTETEQKGGETPLSPPLTVNGHNGVRDGRGTRLAEDWRPDAEDRAYATGLGLDPDATGDRFRDFWLGKPGAGGRKADWPATWRNWCRRASDEAAGRPRTAGNGQPAGGLMGATARVLARQMREAGSV